MFNFQKFREIIYSEKLIIIDDNDEATASRKFMNIDDVYEIIMYYNRTYKISHTAIMNTVFIMLDIIHKVSVFDLDDNFVDIIDEILNNGEYPFIYVITPKTFMKYDEINKLTSLIQKLNFHGTSISLGIKRHDLRYYLLTTAEKKLSELNKLKLYGVDIRKIHVEVAVLNSNDFISKLKDSLNIRQYILSFIDIIETHTTYVDNLYGQGRN